MKTPLQELIEKVEHATDYNLEGADVKEYTWEDLHSDMYKLLEKEKEFIEDVFVDGMYINHNRLNKWKNNILK